MHKFFTYILLINALPCFAQTDIYDLDHSKKYAKHLLKNGNYNWAADEWERVVSLEPRDSNKLVLLKVYRLAEKYDKAETLGLSMLNEAETGDEKYNFASDEYFKSLMLSGKYEVAKNHYSNTYKALPINASVYNFQALFLNKEWKTAATFFNTNNADFKPVEQENYPVLIQRSQNLKYKNPALAATISTVIPGLGKIYTNDWKDGILSFLIVGTSSWQAYQGFSEKGTRSVYGWIYGGLAAGFYAGTIYGSYTSAIRYNNRQEKELIEDAKRIFFSAY